MRAPHVCPPLSCRVDITAAQRSTEGVGLCQPDIGQDAGRAAAIEAGAGAREAVAPAAAATEVRERVDRLGGARVQERDRAILRARWSGVCTLLSGSPLDGPLAHCPEHGNNM